MLQVDIKISSGLVCFSEVFQEGSDEPRVKIIAIFNKTTNALLFGLFLLIYFFIFVYKIISIYNL